ncbi:E3 ubiquitin-protein ligase TRIM32 [Frankliniella fusca]|uniref:E3 ubiquitin-protein ligase TRIM32 n=1 Tax=Frankliniella fusca TaxID=407009 RepID=A0AAE1GRA0_9NEOP|nr:E3 ubiquitin-protein ligase TRIM32 [Frankliniella fusca]
MDLQCSFCCQGFTLKKRKPMMLPCGHTFCKKCVQNPDFYLNCPSCGKVPLSDPVDNISLVKLIDNRNKCKVQKDLVQQLSRGIAAGEELYAQLLKAVPAAVQALGQLLSSTATQLIQLKLALEELRRGAGAAPELVTEQVEQAVRLMDGLRLMYIRSSGLVAVEEDCTTWKAVNELGVMGRLLLVQLLDDGRLGKVRPGFHAEAGARPALGARFLQADGSAEAGGGGVPRQDADDATASGAVTSSREAAKAPLQDGVTGEQDDPDLQAHEDPDPLHQAKDDPFVGPPGLCTRRIRIKSGCNYGKWEKHILEGRSPDPPVRCLNVQGRISEELLRVLAPQLEELWLNGGAPPSVMEEVARMKRLKRLLFKTCTIKDEVYPDLPLQLEELGIQCPKENHLRSVDRMQGLRSLKLRYYFGTHVSFLPRPRQEGLVWLEVYFGRDQASTMLSLIRAHAHSLRVLQVGCRSHELDSEGVYHPHLDQELAATGLPALQQLVLIRPNKKKCKRIYCQLQLRSFQESLGKSVDVVCTTCSGL